MRTIYKYPLKDTIFLPQGAKVLSVGDQEGERVLWALVDTNNLLEARNFSIIGTGWDVTNDPGIHHSKFIGTIHQPPFVWHVFDDTRSTN